MKIIVQIGIVFAVCWLGEIISLALPFTFPASIISMVMLFILLLIRIIKVEHIREKSNFLLGNMSFFFIPVGVSILENYTLIKDNIIGFIVICILGTIITFIVTVFTIKCVSKIMSIISRRRENE